MLRSVLLCVVFCESLAVNAAMLSFGADPAAAVWQLSIRTERCDLEQPIPDFGTARFSYRAASGLVFELETSRPVFTGEVAVGRAAPPWRARGEPVVERVAERVVLEGGSLLLDGERAEGFLRGLYLGDDARWDQLDGAVRVTVSPVNFRALYEPFSDCVASLRPGSFSDLERTSLAFPPSGADLDPAALARIEALARYVATDRRVGKVFVDGHTDATGGLETNLALSKRRAEAVAAALVAQGTPSTFVVVRYHGARYPIASNETEAGRAENRRVTIRLERSAAEVAKR